MTIRKIILLTTLSLGGFISCDKGNDDNTVTCACTATPFSFHDAANWIFIPTAFSPDNDGLNDRLRIFTTGSTNITSFKIAIYNSSSTLVYQSTSTNFSWDGKDMGGLLMPGRYVIRVDITSAGSTSQTCGCVTIPELGAGNCKKVAAGSVYFEDQILGNGSYAMATAELLCP
jgi:gliding motility-associated-like protein